MKLNEMPKVIVNKIVNTSIIGVDVSFDVNAFGC